MGFLGHVRFGNGPIYRRIVPLGPHILLQTIQRHSAITRRRAALSSPESLDPRERFSDNQTFPLLTTPEDRRRRRMRTETQ
ncbi:hypothetical protein [Burkholderia thailandensis]|uniref:hypothetical protein n=1 Tax=Burkholderia thailandensis TaxID=57975 RepID=UPI00165268C8|nr:hypothetical protein [Burkholderia thailandensis]